MSWSLDAPREDLTRAFAAVSEGFCPDCKVPFRERGWCDGCLASWEIGRSIEGVPSLSRRALGSGCTWFIPEACEQAL